MTLADSFAVEAIAALIFQTITLACEIMPLEHTSTEIRIAIIAFTSVLSMLCLKDEDFYPPDSAPQVTLALKSIGAYDGNTEVACRLLAQAVASVVGSCIAIQFLNTHEHKDINYKGEFIVYVMEALGVMIECLILVFLMAPLLTIQTKGNKESKIRTKKDTETKVPSTGSLLQVAVLLAIIHWVLCYVFTVELHPYITLAKSLLTHREGDETAYRILAQCLGAGLAACYTYLWQKRYLAGCNKNPTMRAEQKKDQEQQMQYILQYAATVL